MEVGAIMALIVISLVSSGFAFATYFLAAEEHIAGYAAISILAMLLIGIVMYSTGYNTGAEHMDKGFIECDYHSEGTVKSCDFKRYP